MSQIKIKSKSFRDYFSGVDSDFYEILRKSLQFNPHKRISVDEALRLPLFSEFIEDKLPVAP